MAEHRNGDVASVHGRRGPQNQPCELTIPLSARSSGGAAALPRFRWLATEPVPTASTGIDSGREVPAASSSTGPSAATRSSSSMSARCSPSTGQRGSSGSFWRVTGCFSARDRAVVPASAPRGYSSSEDGLPDPSPDEEWMHLGSEASRTQRPSLRERPSLRGGGRREPGQRGSRRAGRVRRTEPRFGRRLPQRFHDGSPDDGGPAKARRKP
jgi:hypothetical protein